MSEKIDLKEIERKVYLAYHRDGIWDIFWGIAFVGLGISMIYNQVVFMAIIPAGLTGNTVSKGPLSQRLWGRQRMSRRPPVCCNQ